MMANFFLIGDFGFGDAALNSELTLVEPLHILVCRWHCFSFSILPKELIHKSIAMGEAAKDINIIPNRLFPLS